jgi:hypothetical protein
MAVPITPFDPKAVCPKDQSDDPRRTWHDTATCPLSDQEHIHYVCRECKYEWASVPRG